MKVAATCCWIVLWVTGAATSAAWAVPEYGSWGLDTAAMDHAVRPGDDFYRYVVGTWLAKTSIPDDSTYSGFDLTIDNTLKPRLRTIVEEFARAQPPSGTLDRKIGDLYSSYMDEAGIESKGLSPVKSALDAIDGIDTRAALAFQLGVALRKGVETPVSGSVEVDAKNPRRYLFRFAQSGLSFSDRDFYLKDTPEFQKLREEFKAHVARMLKLARSVDGENQATSVLALETAVAKAHWPAEKARDDTLTYNLWKRPQFDALDSHGEWTQILQTAGLAAQSEFLVNEPDTMIAVAGLIDSAPLPQWRSYLRYHTLVAAASYLPKSFDDERFEFYGTVLSGQPKPQERWRRSIKMISNLMGEPLGRIYVERYFPEASKRDMQAMVANLRAALGARIDTARWMSPTTRREARAKLAALGSKLGYPDQWKDYSALKITADDLYGNAQRSRAWAWDFDLGKLGRAVDPGEWDIVPQENNAYYSSERNEIVFPAAILQAPYYDPDADPASNYGEIGATIGHEMSHGFDDQGRKFDGLGMLRDWWTKKDAARYTREAQKLVRQYNAYEPLSGLKINGQQTLGENIADLAGLVIAFDAYRRSLGGRPAPVVDGLSGDQRFFLSYAQSWRIKYRDEILRDYLVSDVHSPSEQRVNGVVRNIDAWYAAFHVGPGDKLYLKPQDRVRPW